MQQAEYRLIAAGNIQILSEASRTLDCFSEIRKAAPDAHKSRKGNVVSTRHHPQTTTLTAVSVDIE